MLNNPMRDCVLMIASLTFACDAASLSYSAKPIRATVVDADTGKPIEGVIVNAYWDLENRGGSGIGPLNVTEAVTDTSGTFFMPGWGPLEVPKPPPPFSSDPMRYPRLNPNQPWLQLFKAGYWFKVAQGDESTGYLSDPTWTGPSVRSSYWNEKAIKLERVRDADKKYVDDLMYWRPQTAIGECWWVKVPRMTAAFIREGERLKSVRGWNQLVRLDEIQERYKGQYCGAPKSMIEELLK